MAIKIYKEKSQCCGCGACTQICPNNCIEMVRDEEGFEYPQINYDKCINCGLCKKICPVINDEEKSEDVKKCYIAYSQEESVREKSSSGGVFSVLAKDILNSGGVVFGAAFDGKWLVRHIAIKDIASLEKLRGSKYVQSRIEETYSEAKRYLEDGKKVLFTGTACQIEGLKHFLGKEYKNLYTVDVLCHGVPSPKVWEKYLKEKCQQNSSDISNISFREKEHGWKRYSMKIQFSNLKEYKKLSSENTYMKLFLSEICLRPSCHDCKFKPLERVSDITIGDCWGIENYMPDMDDDRGTSVVFIHSSKGMEFWKKVSNEIVYREAEKDRALNPMADSRKSVIPHKNRHKFFEKLNKGEKISDLKKLLKRPVGDRVKGKIRSFIKKILK